MIVFRTDVSQYTIRSGPNGPGPHIRRVHYNRPDRYNFFREVRDFRCDGEGSPLIWTWPRGGRVTSADITSIEVHTPDGRVRYDPERDRLRAERRARLWEDTPTVGTFRQNYATNTWSTSPIEQRPRMNERIVRNAESQREQRRSAWRMYLGGLSNEDRGEFMEFTGAGYCHTECDTCIPDAARWFVSNDYVCPLGVWEMELMEGPYENLIDMVRPPEPRRSVRLSDFTSPPEQVPVQEDDPFNHLPF